MTEWVHYSERPENSETAQRARSRYISANENVHRLYNRGAPMAAIFQAEIARDRAGWEWEQACATRADAPEESMKKPLTDAPRTQTCASCGAPVIFAKTNSGTTMILDAEPVENGNVVLAERGLAAVLGKHSVPSPDIPRYVSHHATCPDAGIWRSR